MKIKVTQKDIDSGCRRSIYSCPIARAIQRHLETEIACTQNFWSDGKLSRPLPEVASRFIRDFDNLSPVKPFTFEIEK